MSFVFTNEAAIDEQLGLRLELDMTFRDTTIPTLKLTDLRSGHQWLILTPTISEPITYETLKGQRTSNLDVGVRLNSALIRPVITDLAMRQRNQGRPMTDAEATAIFEDALTVYFMRGGERAKFIPGFRIEWV